MCIGNALDAAAIAALVPALKMLTGLTTLYLARTWCTSWWGKREGVRVGMRVCAILTLTITLTLTHPSPLSFMGGP